MYHDSVMIFSSENIMIFLKFSNYQPLLLFFTYFSVHAYLTQTAQVNKL